MRYKFALFLCSISFHSSNSLSQEAPCVPTSGGEVRSVYTCSSGSFWSLATGALSDFVLKEHLNNFGQSEIVFNYPSGADAFKSRSDVSGNMVRSGHYVYQATDENGFYSVGSAGQRNVGAHLFNITTRTAFDAMDAYERERFGAADSFAIVDVMSTTPLKITLNYSAQFEFYFAGGDGYFGSAGGTVYASSRSDLADFPTFSTAFYALESARPDDVLWRPYIYTNLSLDQPWYTIVTEYDTSLVFYADGGDSVASMEFLFSPPDISCPTCEYDVLLIQWGGVVPVPEPTIWVAFIVGGLVVVSISRRRQFA